MHISFMVYQMTIISIIGVVGAILLEIYDCFIEYEQEPWEELSLYFNCDGEFKIEFSMM